MVADPGSGKSYLVSRLAHSLGMRLKPFNVVQMVTRENLLSCFDAIASDQAHQPREPLLVFFDEINAELEGSAVYDLFLSVLEDGTYFRHGRPFKLQPCAWIFAGTEDLRPHGETTPRERSSKAPDFFSRLTVEPVRLAKGVVKQTDTESVTELESQVRLGFVYRGALLLQKQHPDVRSVSAQVLRSFYWLPEDTSARKLRHLVERCRDIQYGQVRLANMPEAERQRVAHLPADDIWHDIFGDALDQCPVTLELRPPDRVCPAVPDLAGSRARDPGDGRALVGRGVPAH